MNVDMRTDSEGYGRDRSYPGARAADRILGVLPLVLVQSESIKRVWRRLPLSMTRIVASRIRKDIGL